MGKIDCCHQKPHHSRCEWIDKLNCKFLPSLSSEILIQKDQNYQSDAMQLLRYLSYAKQVGGENLHVKGKQEPQIKHPKSCTRFHQTKQNYDSRQVKMWHWGRIFSQPTI